MQLKASAAIFIPMFLIFLTLKLCDVIGWSWWWVTSPLWGPYAFVFSVMGLVILALKIIR